MLDLKTDAGLHAYGHIIVNTGIKKNKKLLSIKLWLYVCQGNVFTFLQI